METEVNTIIVPFKDKKLLHSITVEYFVTDQFVSKGEAELVVRFTHPVSRQPHQIKQLIDSEAVEKQGYLKGVAFALAEEYLKRREGDDIGVIP